ncbi:MAG: hypothetical protein PHE59_04820 [Patescibacteria group bacterium]|nr:hypothetical protein [Patescibacteria group bacterium]
MKLTPAAFETIFWACDPEQRLKVFKDLARQEPAGAVYVAEMPQPAPDRVLTGEYFAKIKLVAVANGAWDVPK